MRATQRDGRTLLTPFSHLVVIQDRVEIFDPDGVDRAVQHNPSVLVLVLGSPDECVLQQAPHTMVTASLMPGTITAHTAHRQPLLEACPQQTALSLVHLRHKTAKMPSVQSPVEVSMRPNIWGAVMALGFMRQMTCLVPSSVKAPASTSMIAVFPLPLGPTSMMP